MSQKDDDEGAARTEDNTEPLNSQDIDGPYTGESCNNDFDASLITNGQRVDAEESFDPDATFLNLSAPVCETRDNDINAAEVSLAPLNCKSDSEISTQPISQSQDYTNFPEEPLKSMSDSVVSTQPIIQSQDSSGNSLDERVNVTSELPSPYNSSQMEVSTDIKPLSSRSEETSVTVASSTTSSSSCVVSSSSSSKRPTDSDDTDDVILDSQDMFASQSSRCSQNVTTVSQLVPTFQLSGDIPLSQGYEGFVPPRLNPSSPTSASTSTPRRCNDKLIFADLKDIISISDEEDVQKINDKRKLSDSSDDCKSEKNRVKKRCVDHRQSIMVVGEFNSATKKSSFINSEDPDLGSQGFSLHLSQSSLELNEGARSPSVTCRSGKFNEEVSSHAPANDDSIVQLDMEDEVQIVSSDVTHISSREIILDSPKAGLSTSADVQVLTPCGENILEEKGAKEDVKPICDGKIDLSPLQKRIDNHSSPFTGPTRKPSSSTPQQHSPRGIGEDFDGSKENIHPAKLGDVQTFETNCVITFTCTARLSCETEIDMVKKELVKNTVHVFKVLDKKVGVQRTDSSASTVEESSPGRSGGSPGSTVSCPGPFLLRPSHATRLSMMSTSSSSSAASSAASLPHHLVERRARGTSQLPGWKGKEPSISGAVPWQTLLQHKHDQDEFVVSTSEFLDAWASSCINDCSSDESKTNVEDKVLDSVPEQDNGEEVLGVPPKSCIKKYAKSVVSSASNDTGYGSLATATSSKTEENVIQPNKETPIQSECDSPPTSRRKRGRPPKAATPVGTPKSSTKKKVPTPKSKGPQKSAAAPELSSVPEDSHSSGSSAFTPETQVFALWADKKYYPGHVKSAARGDHWNIVFHDKCEHEVHKNNIMVINTFEIGQSVSASMGNGHYEGGTIVGVDPVANGEELYTVHLPISKKEVTVSMSDLMLSMKQMEQCYGDRPGSTFSASSSPTKRSSASKSYGSDRDILKNLDLLHDLPGKRVRTPKGNQSVSSPSRPGPSNTARRLIPEVTASDSTADDEPLASTLQDKGPSIHVAGLEPEQVGFRSADPLARKGKGTKNRTCKKPLPDIEDEKTIQELGPIPQEGSKLFSGYTFFITYTEVKPRPKSIQHPTSDSEMPTTDNEDAVGSDGSSQYPSDSECFKHTHYPMVKDRLIRQIISGGGQILKDWTEIVVKNINNTFVVSNRPCLTATYVHCLARGIRSVMHDYIIDCCKQDEKFKIDQRFYLSMGYSHIKKDWMTWAAHKCKSPLRNQKIVVVGNDRNFVLFWEDLLKVAGATIAKVKDLHVGNVDVVVSENLTDPTKLNIAFNQNIPVVSPYWITQSLICNKPLPYNALPWFAYDYVDSE